MNICVSLGSLSFEQCREFLHSEEIVELRLDLLDCAEHIEELLRAAPSQTIVSFRSVPEKYSDSERKILMQQAVGAGATYLDIDISDATSGWQDLIQSARSQGCKVIVSHHDYVQTPGRETLLEIIDTCFSSGADIAKVACMVNQETDNAVLLGLLNDRRCLIVTGMGEVGRITRLIAPLLGSYLTYACPQGGSATAPGQFTISELRALYKTLGVAL